MSCSKTMLAHILKLAIANGSVTSLTCWAGFMNLKHPKVDAMYTCTCVNKNTAL